MFEINVDIPLFIYYNNFKGGDCVANVSVKPVYVDNELHRRIKILAATKGITVGKLVEIAIEKLEDEK